MIVRDIDIAKVKSGRRTQMWLPAQRGELGEMRPCTLEYAGVYPLQPAAFAAGVVDITIVSVETATLGEMTDLDARRQGHASVQDAKEAWARAHGDASDSRQAWRIDFVRGDRSSFLLESQTRYLNRKMGGAHDYTFDPAKSVRGEGPALSDDELKLLGAAAERRAVERKSQEKAQIDALPLEQRIARLEETARRRGVDLSSEIRLIRQRVSTAEQTAQKSVVRAQ